MSDIKGEGIIVILSSPSGAGKTSLVKEISIKKKFNISISHTTRKPRKNETNGVHYYFVTKFEFKNLIKQKKFLEHAKVFNNFYGSSKQKVINQLESGKNVIFDIDWQGTKQIINKKLKFRLITFFILPPSRVELKNRLLKRENNNSKIVEERMLQFDKDVQKWKDYDFVVINDNFEKCCKEITKIIENKIYKKKDLKFNKKLISKHVEDLIN